MSNNDREHVLGKVSLHGADNEIHIVETNEDDDDDDDEMDDLEDTKTQVQTSRTPHRASSSHSSRSKSPPKHTNSGKSSRFRRTATAERKSRRQSDGFSSGGGGNSMWKNRAEEGIDQSLNLMDQTSDVYGVESRPTTRGRARPGMSGTRQKSLVDVFLTDGISTRGGHSADYGVTDIGFDGSRRNRKCRWILLAVGGILVLTLLFVAVPKFGIVPLFYKNDDDNNNQENAAETTPAPTPATEVEEIEEEVALPENVRPLAAGESLGSGQANSINLQQVPTSNRLDALEFFVVDQDITDPAQLDIQGSPAKKALHWLSQQDTAKMQIPGFDAVMTTEDQAEHALLQRYGLAVFYYSMQAASSSNAEGNSGRRLGEQLQQPAHLLERDLQTQEVYEPPSLPTDEELANREAFDNDWLSPNHICQWHGVVCDDDFESVVAVELPSHLLQGTIPRELLVGGAMPYLKRLDLSMNQLQGSLPVVTQQRDTAGSQSGLTPPSPSLEELVLSENRLTGYLDNLMDLTNLRVVRLSANQITGPIPDEIMDLSKLEELRIGENRLSGNLPGDSFGELTALKILDLEDNSLNEDLPMTLYALTNLEALILSGNQFSGKIPNAYGDLTNLRRLDLDGNDIGGQVPSELGKLKKLERLQLDGTELMGEVPQEVCTLTETKLKTFVADCDSGEIKCDCCTECF